MNSAEGWLQRLALIDSWAKRSKRFEQEVELAGSLPERPGSDGILIADPEDLGADEPVFLVEDRQSGGRFA